MIRPTIVFLSIVLLVFSAGVCAAAGKTEAGSGNIVTEERDIRDFERVELSSAFKARVNRGDTFRVVIRIDDNLLGHLRVVKHGSTLDIGLAPGIFSVVRATLEAEITMPSLAGLSLSGASQADIGGFEMHQPLDITMSGASSVQGDMLAADIRFALSGAGKLNLTGSAKAIRVKASGASSLDLSSLPASEATVDLSGASSVTVNTNGQLNVKASGASKVFYMGEPKLGTINTSGASSVRPK